MKAGRNDPCPCGSGKKYKKCCLSTAHLDRGREDSIQERLVQDLLLYFRDRFGESLEDASALFWGDFDPDEHLDERTSQFAGINFFDWLVHDYAIDEDSGKTLIDFYLEENRQLSPEERGVLTVMKNVVISLYEVQEVFAEKGLLLRDLLRGGEYDVRERAATRSLRKWDVFAARLVRVDGTYIMSGSVYPYRMKDKEAILQDIRKLYKKCRRNDPGMKMDEYLKRNGEIFNFYWYDIVRNPPPLHLSTTTGEPFLFSKAVFEIKDRQAVMNALVKIRGFEEDEEGFIWFDKRDAEGSATILGNIDFKGGRLALSCNSKKRLDRGKKLILKHCAGALAHKADTFQDPMKALEDYEMNPPAKRKEGEVPFEVQQQLYTKFMEKHCEKWLKDTIPALDDKTPFQAIKTADGRRRVAGLLKLFENTEEHNKREGRPFYDMTWMWERLGMKRE